VCFNIRPPLSASSRSLSRFQNHSFRVENRTNNMPPTTYTHNGFITPNSFRIAEMKYLRRAAGYTLLNHKINEEILEELHVTPLEDKLRTYRHKWFQHIHRTEDNRLPKQLLNYHLKGKRRPGRSRQRLLDDMTAETETDHTGLNSWLNMMMMSFRNYCC
jgi:hypothetical protein